MQTFKPIIIGNTSYRLNELTFHDAVKISRIPERMNEHRISVFLAAVLRDDQIAQKMTVQERYYILIQYLSTQTDTVISSTLTYEDYLFSNQSEFKTTLSLEQADLKINVRQLTGRDAELLETLCDGVADWIVGAMALQLDMPENKEIPVLHSQDCSEAEHLESLKTRANAFKNLELSRFNRFYNAFDYLQSEMSTLCRLGFDDSGITVLGGTDDAPARFRPAAALTGIAAQLDRYAAAKGQSVGRGHPDDV
ncbi:MAG TPA: hypothetical protein PLM98_09065 [Thiolinea sp.]|nr:hypothetical protein [Thiolinea sp.]